jgi:predicted TIM-barrel fold metal-dependent hydrolase
MADFCSAGSRLIGVAMVPPQDVSRALAEIEQVQRLGLDAVWIPADAPAGRSPGHVAHEPIWASLEEARIPFILH